MNVRIFIGALYRLSGPELQPFACAREEAQRSTPVARIGSNLYDQRRKGLLSLRWLADSWYRLAL